MCWLAIGLQEILQHAWYLYFLGEAYVLHVFCAQVLCLFSVWGCPGILGLRIWGGGGACPVI